MKKTTILVAASCASLGIAALLLTQVRVASAASAPVRTTMATEPAVSSTSPVAPNAAAPMSRRERMVRIVAEQAAISAEASARSALAKRAAEREQASP